MVDSSPDGYGITISTGNRHRYIWTRNSAVASSKRDIGQVVIGGRQVWDGAMKLKRESRFSSLVQLKCNQE